MKHTALKILEVIHGEGYEGGYTAVKDAVRALKPAHPGAREDV